jgi:catechol 2,3-dioxygenase-like lactoylglutathione lyase family enzyme
MINGAHVIVFSKEADRDRAFFRDVLGLPSVDVGGGWLIFGLPPAELAVHPADFGGTHELYLMCADIEETVQRLGENGVTCGPIQNQGWGLLTSFTLPGGGQLAVYQPRHARPDAPATATKSRPKTARTKARKPPPQRKQKSPMTKKKPVKATPKATKRKKRRV